MSIKSLFLIGVVGLFSQSAAAENFEIAEQYIASYTSFDLEQLEKLYSEGAAFKDLTTESRGEKAFIIEGRDNILERFGKPFFQDKFSLHYAVDNKFESSGHHVFNGVVTARTDTKNGVKYSCGNVVTIIKIVDEKVVSHIDYADYKGFKESGKNEGKDCHHF